MATKSFLSDQTKELILGSILGDGSLCVHKPYRNARFSFRHSVHQEEYFFWKMSQLKEISSEKCWWRQGKNGLGDAMLRYQSLALPRLSELYGMTHERGKLTIRRKWLNTLTPLSLAVWWLDDGSIIANGRKGVFCTESFSYKEQKILARYLLTVWGVKVSIGKIVRLRSEVARTYYRLWFRSTQELKKFLLIILPFIKVPSVLPKVMLLYRDSKLQQRWISDVSRLTGFSESVIHRAVREKKAKWKAFRK